jgi:hypothetical protein
MRGSVLWVRHEDNGQGRGVVDRVDRGRSRSRGGVEKNRTSGISSLKSPIRTSVPEMYTGPSPSSRTKIMGSPKKKLSRCCGRVFASRIAITEVDSPSVPATVQVTTCRPLAFGSRHTCSVGAGHRVGASEWVVTLVLDKTPSAACQHATQAKPNRTQPNPPPDPTVRYPQPAELGVHSTPLHVLFHTTTTAATHIHPIHSTPPPCPHAPCPPQPHLTTSQSLTPATPPLNGRWCTSSAHSQSLAPHHHHMHPSTQLTPTS